MEVAARHLDAFRNRLAMANHPHRERKSVGSNVARDRVVELLQLRSRLFIHPPILTPKISNVARLIFPFKAADSPTTDRARESTDIEGSAPTRYQPAPRSERCGPARGRACT